MLTLFSYYGTLLGIGEHVKTGAPRDQVFHLILGDSRRLALLAALLGRLDLKPGDHLLLTEGQDELTLCSLRKQAQRMRQELRDI